MPKTLNKDGTPRKKGSGKTKGAGCYTPVTWSELKNLISDDVQIPVSRVWLRSLGGNSAGEPTSTITSPSSKISAPKYDQPKKSKIPTASKEKDAKPTPATDEEYEPPPLFAVGSSNLRQY